MKTHIHTDLCGMIHSSVIHDILQVEGAQMDAGSALPI